MVLYLTPDNTESIVHNNDNLEMKFDSSVNKLDVQEFKDLKYSNYRKASFNHKNNIKLMNYT